MSEPGSDNLRAILQDIQSQLERPAARVAGLEELASMGGAESSPTVALRNAEPRVTEPPATTSPAAVEAGISEEEVLAPLLLRSGWACMRTSAKSASFAPALGLNKAE